MFLDQKTKKSPQNPLVFGTVPTSSNFTQSESERVLLPTLFIFTVSDDMLTVPRLFHCVCVCVCVCVCIRGVMVYKIHGSVRYDTVVSQFGTFSK